MPDRLETFRAMVARQPDNPLARFGLANELRNAGLHAEAAEEYAAYLARYDDEGNGWMRYAEMLHALDRTTEAYDAIARGIAAADKYRHSGLIADREALRESFDD